MKPAPFSYHRAESLAEAAALRGELDGETRVLAGGQSLLPLMNLRRIAPRHLIDINRVAGADAIEAVNGHVAIGAVARQAAIERDALVTAELPLLREALARVATPPVRHRGTLVGSLAHADPSAELPAVALALDGHLDLVGPVGSRTVAAADFFLGEGRTAVADDEVIERVRLRRPPAGSGQAFVEVSRTFHNRAVVGAAAVLTIEDGVVRESAVALCGVSSAPVRAAAAEALLNGVRPDGETIAAAAAAAADQLTPFSDVNGSSDYRRRIAGVLARRAIETALARCAGGN